MVVYTPKMNISYIQH